MTYLIAVSLIWAFSFAIIGSTLSSLDSTFAAALRLGIAWLCFLPFFRPKGFPLREFAALAGIGALQFGLMYVSYMRAFAYLPSHLVALFSIFTPLYIALAYATMQRRWGWSLLGCALLSIAGAAAIKFSRPSEDFWLGFALMQVANFSFGLGQLLYRQWRVRHPSRTDHSCMAPLYAGGAAIAAIGFLVFGDPSKTVPDGGQIAALLYLGAVASGAGFYLWNKGATMVSPAALAASNNALVPIALFVSLILFSEAEGLETETLLKLALGAALIFGAMALGQATTKASARQG